LSSSFSAIPQERKASNACIENLQIARERFSGKQQRSTPNLSDGDEGRTSDDEIVHLNSFKPQPKLIHNIPDGQQQ